MKQFKQVLLVSTFLMLFLNVGWGQNITPVHTGTIASFSLWTHNSCVQGNASSNDYIIMNTAASSVISPSMNFNNYTLESIGFKARTYGGPSTAQATITISISTNNGTSWTVLGTRIPSSSTLTVMTSFDVSTYNGTQVLLKLQTLGAGSSKGVGVDDISITGTLSGVTPSLSITNNGSQPSAGNIGTGTNNNILQKFQITEGNIAAAMLTQVTVPLSGTYLTADINGSGLKLYSTTVSTFTSPTLLSSQAGNSTGSGQTVTFGSLTSAISKGGTVYYWVTADISTSATISRTINASALSTSNFTFSSGTITGASVNAGGVQTIISMLPPSAPAAITATSITSNSFTANWNSVADATSYRLDVMTSLGTANNIIQEGFDNGTTAPSGWTFTGISETYTSSGNYGVSSPSLKFDNSNDRIETSIFSNPTQLSFWIKGQSTDLTSALLVEEYYSSSWNIVANITNLPTTGTTKTYSLNDATTKVRFTYTKSAGNLSFDDVLISGYSSPVYVSGYENKTVNGLSDNVTGLNSGTDYYYRVRAVNSYGTSSNSNVITTTTLAGSNISVSPTSLTGFSYVLGSGPSVSQSFVTSGTRLSGDITVTGTTNYEVSLTNSAFFNSVTLPQTGGVVNSTPVYVRLKSGLSVGTYNNENVTLTSTGATTKSVTCNGSVVETAQIVYWDGGASTANWNDAANWSNDAVPTTTSEVVLDNTNVSENYSVNIGATNVAIKKLSIIPLSSNTITLTLTSANTGTPGLQVGDNTNGTDDIIIGEGGVLINLSGAGSASPIALIPETLGGTFRINNGGKYSHKTLRSHKDLVTALSTVAGTESGIFEFDIPLTANSFVALQSRTFGTLRFRNSTAFNYTTSGVTTGPIIRGNLEFENYNGGAGLFSTTELFIFNIAGNFTNNGVNISFPNQTFNFNGSSNQTISGTGSITFSNLTLNNSNGLTLNRDITVNGLLTLTNGKLLTGDYFLDFGASATFPTETNSNYILGRTRLNNKPVGTASLSFLGAYIHAGTDDIGNVSITRTTGSAYIFGSNEGINCSWNIVPTTQPANGRLLDFNWFSVFDNGKNFSPTNKAQVWKSNDNGSTWLDAGVLVDVSNDNPRSITNISTTSFSLWSVSAQDAPLPVTLASLNSSVSGKNNIRLNWITSSETNNSGFNIERMLSAGTTWEKIGYVQGHGTVNTPTNYSFEDKNLQTGKYKYRLKQIDHNGNYEYFELNGEVEIGVPKKYDLSQNYPNPFNPVTKINFDLPVDSKVTMLIYDITGREVARILNGEFKKAGYHTTDFNASSLSSGVYFYSLNTDAFRMTKKMVVLK